MICPDINQTKQTNKMKRRKKRKWKRKTFKHILKIAYKPLQCFFFAIFSLVRYFQPEGWKKKPGVITTIHSLYFRYPCLFPHFFFLSAIVSFFVSVVVCEKRIFLILMCLIFDTIDLELLLFFFGQPSLSFPTLPFISLGWHFQLIHFALIYIFYIFGLLFMHQTKWAAFQHYMFSIYGMKIALQKKGIVYVHVLLSGADDSFCWVKYFICAKFKRKSLKGYPFCGWWSHF